MIKTAVLAMLVCSISGLARDHAFLNGTWVLVPAKSDFSGQPVVETGTVTIADKGGVIIVERSFKYEGATETFFYNDSTGTESGSTIKSGKDLKSKTKWEHDVLTVTTTQAGAITLESYSLAPDGSMMVRVERPGHQVINLVFHRQ